MLTFKERTHSPNCWPSEVFGETRTRSLEASESRGRCLFQILQAKSEEVGHQPSGPLDTLIAGVLANQCSVWEGQNTVCAMFFCALHSVISCFHVASPAYCSLRQRRTYTLLWSWKPSKRCVQCLVEKLTFMLSLLVKLAQVLACWRS